MRYLFVIFLTASVLFAGTDRKIKRQFPEILSLDSIQSSDEVIIARIDFNFQDAVDQFDSTFYNKTGPKMYARIVNKKNDGDSLSDFDKECLELGEERAIKEKIYEDLFGWSFPSILFDIFANKTFFSNDLKIRQSEFDSIKVGVIQQLQLVISSVHTENAASLFKREAEDRNEKINFYPIALFLAKNDDGFCWIYIESWEYRSMGINLLNGSTNPNAPLGHIRGTIFNFDFNEKIGFFQCG